MKQATIWTAAAAATVGIAADAAAAPVTYDVAFTSASPVGLTGTGFFTIDDSALVPNTTISDVAVVDAFGATFTSVPGFGTLSFDLDDLTAVTLKTDSSGDLSSATFGTTNNGTDPFLANIFEETNLKISNGQGSVDPIASYSGALTLRTTEVPEPGTLALLAAGAAGLPLLRRRRAERKSA